MAVRVCLLLLGLLMPVNLPFALPNEQSATLGWTAAPAAGPGGAGLVVRSTSWSAQSAGLVPGDVVLRVNGEPATLAALERVRRAAPPGKPLRLTVRRPEGAVELAVPLPGNPPNYPAYLWYRVVLAGAAWAVGMALVLLRGRHGPALALGAGMLLVAPVTLAVEVARGAPWLTLANAVWQLQAAAYRFAFPLLLLAGVVLSLRDRPAAFARPLWAPAAAGSALALAVITDGFREPLAWRAPGLEQEVRAGAGLAAEALAVAGCVLVLRRTRELGHSLRWLALVSLAFLSVGLALSVAVLLPDSPPEAVELLRQIKSLLLLLLVAVCALHLFAAGEREPGEWRLRGRLAASASWAFTGLYAFAVAGAAAIMRSVGHHLGGGDALVFAGIFAATIAFSPVLRWAREMVDRQMFRRWAELEARAHAFVDRIGAELEPVRIAEAVGRELPPLLEVARARLVFAEELVAAWETVQTATLERAPRAALADDVARGRMDGDAVVGVYRPNGELLGALRAGPRLHGRPWEAPDYAVLRTLAQGVAAAIRNAESYLTLRRAQRELDRAEREASLGALAAGLAHEIKNPLASLRMGLYLLERNPGDGEKLARIQRDVRRIDDLVSGLLRFASDGIREPAEAIDLCAVVRDCVTDLRGLAEDRGTRIFESYPEGPAHVSAGRSQLRLVVSNLLANALDAAGADGTVHVAVRGWPDRVELAVQDDGPGIPAEQRKRIFEPYFSTKPRGTGLGLALARRETERLGGTIAAAEGLGGGTVLRVLLPRVTLSTDHSDPDSARPDPTTGAELKPAGPPGHAPA